MNKADLGRRIAEAKGLTIKEGTALVELVLGLVEESLVAKEEVSLFGFGSFKVVEKPESKARNPKTQEEVIVPAKTVIKFKPAKGLKDKVNNPLS